MTAILVLSALVIFVAVEYLRIRVARRRQEAGNTAEVYQSFSDVRLPQGLFLGGQHTWARLTSLGELKVGMDELLSQAIGGVDRVDLPEVGARVEDGQPFARVWRAGRALEIVSPVSGTIVVANNEVGRDGSSIDSDPYGSGWIATVWPEDHKEALESMRIGNAAVKWLRRDTQRFCDFLAEKTSSEVVGAALADGAHPVVGAAQTLNDVDWLQFEKEFAR